MSSAPITLQFFPPQSSFDPSFWEELYERKLNKYGLSDEDIPIFNASKGSSSGYSFDRDSFTIQPSYAGRGVLRNFNTIEDFGRCDKKALIATLGQTLIDSLISGAAISDPSLLRVFSLLSFADLKAYKFVFWLVAPVPTFVRPPTIVSHSSMSANTNALQYVVSAATTVENSIFCVRGDITGYDFETLSIAEAWKSRYDHDMHFVVPDSCTNDAVLGWETRNLIALLALYSTTSGDTLTISRGASPSAAQKHISVFALRGSHSSSFSASRHFIIEVSLAQLVDMHKIPEGLDWISHWRSQCSFVGWEQNERGKPAPRQADVSALLDSTALMKQAVDLNLRLMKWRLWPSLNTLALSTQRVLLLGAGTLGCSVARNLIGWGVRRITFVDSGVVSYSNPVRQSLFEFDDAQQRRFKAVAAADRLCKIFPAIEARSEVLSIPMPGHPFNDSSSSSGSTESKVLTDESSRKRLEELIDEHDFVFALTDSREARWLPAMLCARQQKPMLNVALGFDTFLVMRHPCNLHGREMSAGCYFCSDIVAAGNSQRERTLDQQCTVTRPGLSGIAGALAVELMVAMVQRGVEEDIELPQQIRGSVLGFTQMTLQTHRFPQCTACSHAISDAYSESPAAFTRQVCADPQLLERLSGIEEMMKAVNLDDVDVADDEDDF